MTLQTTALLTAEEFAALGDIGSAELIRGRVVLLTKPKPKHGRIAMRFGLAIGNFVYDRELGEVYAAETGFQIEHNPDSIRAPDVAFVRAELALGQDEDQWYPHSPDLAVEVLSPGERAGEVAQKVRLWLDGGARSVWIADPTPQSVTVHHADWSTHVISRQEELRDEIVLPGFSVKPLSKLLGKSRER